MRGGRIVTQAVLATLAFTLAQHRRGKSAVASRRGVLVPRDERGKGTATSRRRGGTVALTFAIIHGRGRKRAVTARRCDGAEGRVFAGVHGGGR